MDWKFFTEKKGPLPVWAWAAIAAVMLYLIYRHFRSSSTSTSNTTPTGAATDTGSLAPSGLGSGGSISPFMTVPPMPMTIGSDPGSTIFYYPPPDSSSASNPPPPNIVTDTSTPVQSFSPAPIPAPGQSAASLAKAGVQITPGTVVTDINPGAGSGTAGSGIAGFGGGAGGTYVPQPTIATSSKVSKALPTSGGGVLHAL